MDEELKKVAISEVGKKPLMVIGILQVVGFLLLFASPFIYIWGDGSLAFKVGISSILIILIMRFFYWVVEESLGNVIEREYKKLGNIETNSSKFQDRLNKIIEERGKYKI